MWDYYHIQCIVVIVDGSPLFPWCLQLQWQHIVFVWVFIVRSKMKVGRCVSELSQRNEIYGSLQWRHVSVIVSQITGYSAISYAVRSGSQRRKYQSSTLHVGFAVIEKNWKQLRISDYTEFDIKHLIALLFNILNSVVAHVYKYIIHFENNIISFL